MLALAGASAGCTPQDETEEGRPAPIPATIHYTALGDSLATGAGAQTSYVAEYAAWLQEETGSSVEVTNLAVNGWTSQHLLDELSSDARMRAAVAEAHVLTWDIGGNDLLAALWSFLQGSCGGPDGQACFREALDTVDANGDAILAELLDLRGGVSDGLRTIELYLPFMDDPRVAPYVGGLRPYLDAFNQQLRERVGQHGIEVADVSEAFHGPDGDRDPVAHGLISDDGVHPSSRGHRLIAEQLAALGLELAQRD